MLCNGPIPAMLSLDALQRPDPCNAALGCPAKFWALQCSQWMLCIALTTEMIPLDVLHGPDLCNDAPGCSAPPWPRQSHHSMFCTALSTAMMPVDVLQRPDPCNAAHWILWMFIVFRTIGEPSSSVWTLGITQLKSLSPLNSPWMNNFTLTPMLKGVLCTF